MKHKNAEIIKSFVDGIECEWFSDETDTWVKIYSLISFDLYCKVRIKPEPQKEQKPQYLYIYKDRDNKVSVYYENMTETYNNWIYMGKVEVIK